MTIQSWSDDILLGELQDDPVLSDDLNAIVDQLEKDGTAHVVLDFANVNYLNSSNIAKLLKLRKMLAGSDGHQLKLCGINSHVWGVFLITGLDKLFDFADNVSLGLASIQINDGASDG